MDGLADGLPDASVEPAPARAIHSSPIAPSAWYDSQWIQLAALLLFLVAFMGYPLTAAVRRIRGRRGAPPVRSPARWLVATGLASTMGSLVHVFFMMATAATVLSWRRHHRDLTRAHQARLGLLVLAGLVFLPWATYWGLLIP
jgi:hypothetical protein